MQFTSRCYLFCFRFEISKIRSYSFFRSLYPSCNYNRFFTVFLFFFFLYSSLRTQSTKCSLVRNFYMGGGDCYRILALVQVCFRFTAWNEQQIAQRSDFYSNEQRTARTAMAKHARDLPRDNLLVNQNDAWRYKVTRQRTRLTINFNTRHHQISRRCFPRWLPTDGGAYPSASATVRLMPRSLTTIILEDLALPISHGRHELLSSS